MAEIIRYVKHRRATAAAWALVNPILKLGQLGIETDGLLTSPKFKIGNGVTAWNTLPYATSGSGITFASVVTGFVSTGTSTAVVNTDTLEEALEKLQGQIDYLKNNTVAG